MNDSAWEHIPLSNAELVNNDSFERLRSRKIRRTFDEWVFIVLILLLLSAALFFVCGLIFFRAKEVVIEGSTYYSGDEILAECGITDKDNLFFISEKELEDRLTLQFPYIERITLKRRLPTTVIIHVEEDSPAYFTEIGGEAFLLSQSLRVLDYASKTRDLTRDTSDLCQITLPTVTYAVVGRRLEFERASTYNYMIEFLSVLNSSDYAGKVGRINAASKFRISIYLCDNQYKVILGSAESAEEKLLFFTNIKRQKLEENAFAVVDVSDLDRAFVSIREGPIVD